MISTVPQNHCRIIERLGKGARVQKAGLNFHIPILEKPKNLLNIFVEAPSSKNTGAKDSDTGGNNSLDSTGYFIELSEQICDIEKFRCISNDGVDFQLDAIVFWRIVDPMKAVYEADNLHLSIQRAAQNAIRARIGTMAMEDVSQARQKLGEDVVLELAATSKRWGIILTKVEIEEVIVDDSTKEAMLQQIAAERKARAQLMEAEANAKAIIKVAEGQKAAEVLKAEGYAESLVLKAEAERMYVELLKQEIDVNSASNILHTSKLMQSCEIMSHNPANKIYIPGQLKNWIHE